MEKNEDSPNLSWSFLYKKISSDAKQVELYFSWNIEVLQMMNGLEPLFNNWTARQKGKRKSVDETCLLDSDITWLDELKQI